MREENVDITESCLAWRLLYDGGMRRRIRTVWHARALSHGGSSPRGYRLSDLNILFFYLEADALNQPAPYHYFLRF